MPENDVNTEQQESDGSKDNFTKDEVSDLIKKRLRKHAQEKEALEQQVASLQQGQSQSPVGQEMQPPGAISQQAPLPPGQPIDPSQQQASGAPQEEQSPLTHQSMQQLLIENNQQMASNQSISHSRNSISKMQDEDENFKKISEKNEFGIPQHVAVKITNSMGYDNAKRVLTELLTNETTHMKMENHLLKGQFDVWLSKILSTPESNPEASPKTVPDLSSQTVKEGGEINQDNLDNYMGR